MATCHYCKEIYDSFFKLWKHLQEIHKMHALSSFACGNCVRVVNFNNLTIYASHFKNCHTITTSNRNSLNLGNNNSQSQRQVVAKKQSSSCFTASNKFQLNLHKELLFFSSDLYSRSNIARKDIQFIVEKTGNLLNLVANHVDQSFQRVAPPAKNTSIKSSNICKIIEEELNSFNSDYYKR